MRRLAAAALLALLAASCGGPRAVVLDADDASGIRVRDARATLWKRGVLQLEAIRTGRMSISVPTAALETSGARELRRYPLLHVALRPTERPPSPLRGSVLVRAGGAAWSSPFDLGIPSAGGKSDLWVDLARGAVEVPGDPRRLDSLEVRLDPTPGRVEIERIELWPRTLRARIGLLESRLREPRSLEGGTLAILLVLVAGTVATLGELGTAILRLPRPLPPAVAGNAVGRFARLWPERTLAAAMATIALLGLATVLRGAKDVHTAWLVAGSLSERDHWDVRLSAIHRDLLRIVQTAAKLPAGEPLTIATGRLDARTLGIVRHALWPRAVFPGPTPRPETRWLAAIGDESLPSIVQDRPGRWLALTPESNIGQVYRVPAPGRYIASIELEARKIEPGETLQILLHATGRGHKIHGSAQSRGSASFRFTPPEWLYGAETRFQVVHLGGGDGRVELAAGPGNPYPDGFAVAADARWGDDLTFTIRTVPEAFEPFEAIGVESHLFRRSSP